VKRRSIRWRIQLWFLSMTTVLLAGFSVALYLRAEADELARLDQSLRERASGMAAGCECEDGLLRFDAKQRVPGAEGQVPRRAVAMRTWPEGRELYRSPAVAEPAVTEPGVSRPDAQRIAGLQAGACSYRDLSLDGVPMRCCTLLQEASEHDDERQSQPQVLVEVMEEIGPLRSELRTFALTLLLIGGIAIACAAAAGSFLARRIADPLARIAAETSQVEARGEGVVAAPRTGDEIDSLAESLNRAFARLREAYRRQTRFTADASHELRTPLAVILTASEVALRREREPDEYRAALAEIVKAARRSEETLAGLLLLARAEAGRLETQEETLLLAEVMSEAAACNPRVRCSVAGDTTLRGDRRLLRMLGENLIANALRCSQAEDEVAVRVQAVAAGVRVEVEDRGIGIAPDKLPHVFEPFFRADEARSRAAGGSGLGLAIVRAIADLHGAHCGIRSRQGEGTCVTVEFEYGGAGGGRSQRG